MTLILQAIGWAIFATLLSQSIGLFVMYLLGLPPRRLVSTIEDKQNTAVGAIYFIISLITAIYVSTVTGDGYDPAGNTAETLAWIFGGAFMGLSLTLIIFWIAHRLMDPLEGENLYGYIRREIIDEENAALAFFLGGLAVAPFLTAVQQII
jgi:uncharacterized membrane protein YjfL (UPF0719 family)